jgi:enamine deaminase RidA (YjgF/YER057c/UK114 family)
VERAVSNRIVNPDSLMAPRGYSHVVIATGTTVFLAGQTAHQADGTLKGTTLTEQFGPAAANLITALTAAGGQPEDLTYLQIFVTDVAEYRASTKELGAAWREHFGRHFPATGLFGVTELADPAARVELMGIAVIQR